MKSIKLLLTGITSLFLCSIAPAMPPATPQNLRPAWVLSYYAPAEPFAIWEAVPGATSYNIYRSDNSATNWALIASGVTVPFYSDPLATIIPADYTVTAVNADGESPGAGPVSVNEAFAGYIMVTELGWYNNNLTATNAILEWVNGHPIGEEGLVEWGPAQAIPTNYIAYAINTNYLPWQRFNLTNLTPLTTYQYRITSINPQRGGLRYTNYFTTRDTNHPPVIQYMVYLFQPDTSSGVGINYWATDVDFPQQNITFQLTQPTNGSLAGPWESWTSEGTRWGVSYTPNPGSRGLEGFTVTANDGVDTVTAVIQFTNWMNTPPLAGFLTTNVVEDTPTLIPLPNYDAEGDPISFEVFTPYGGIVTGTPPNLIFVPDTNRTGEASFSWWASDSYSTNWGWMSINITPVNDRPVAYPSSFFTWEEMTVSTWLNWSDVEYGVPMSAVIVRPPAHGTLSGDIYWMQYTPETNFHGLDSFDFVIREEDGTTSDPATVTIQVSSQNDPPTVPAETFYTREDVAVSFTVGAIDGDGDALTYWINSGPFHGTLTGTLPNVTYTPEPGYFGYDTFNYSATDGFESRPNNITLGVGVNSLPRPTLRRHIFEDGIVRLTWNDLGAQHYNVYRADGTNAPFTLLASNVVATNFNDETAQWQQPYWYRIRSWDGTNEGQPSLAKFAYPDETGLLNLNQMNWVYGGTTGRVSFYYSLESGIEAIFEYGTNRNYGITLENTNLLPTQVFGLAGLTPGTVYYFRITTTDAKGNSLVASTNIFQDWFVTQPRPIADPQSISIAEDTTGAVTPTGSDSNGRPLTFSIVSNPTHGTVSIVTVTGGYYYFYVPALNYFGSDTFTYKANNGELDSLPATININVTPVNDAPVASNQSIVMAEDSSRSLVLTGTDVEGGALTYQIIQSPTNGTFIAGTPPNLTYRPATNYFGTDSFKFTVQDSQFATATGTVSITITNINDRPTALAQSVTVAEDSSLVIAAVGIDPDGDVLQLLIQTLPTNGTLSLYTTQTVLYTPNTNFTGTDSFLVRVADGKINSLLSVPVNITVTPANDRPTANPQSVSTPEDSAKSITLTGSDVEGSALTFSIVTPPAHGTLTGTGATRTYTPAANYFGSDVFLFTASDGSTSSAPATVNLTVTAVNDAPVAIPISIIILEDSSTNLVLGGTDLDGDTLSYSVVSVPTHGTLTGTAPNVTYTPAENFFGSDSFVFSVSDGATNSTATVSINVSSIGDLPAPQNLRRRFYVTQYSWPPANTNLHLWWHGVSGADSYNIYRADGTNAPLALLASGVAATNFVDTTSEFGHFYTYQVTAVNAVDEGSPATTTALLNGGGLIEPNESGWGMWATRSHVIFCNTLIIGGEGQFDWGLTTNYTFSVDNTNLLGCHHVLISNLQPETVYFYRIISTDVNGNATVYRDSFVTAPAPFGNPQDISLNEDTFVDITLTGQDPAYSGWLSTLTYSVVSGVSHGTLVALNANTYRYTPSTNFNGTDSFTFNVNNGELYGAPATVNITVGEVNDFSEAADISLTTAEDAEATIPASFTDLDGGLSVSVQILSQPAHGTVDVSETNLVYLPATNFFGTDSFTYSVSDGYGYGNTATVFLTITNVEDSPVAFAQSVTAAEDANSVITLTGVDPDGDSIAFSIFTSPSHGTLSGTAPNMTYRPATNYIGSDSFSFRTYDGKNFSAPATVSITVTPVNDPPIASNIVVTVVEDIAVMIPPAFIDPEGDFVAIEPPVQLVGLPAHGTAWTDGFNMFYRPATNYTGADSFTYHVTDGVGFGNTATVSISVTPVNDAPIALPQSLTLGEDSEITFSVSATDVDSSEFSFEVVTSPTNGTLNIAGTNYTYRPATNFNGGDSLTFRAFDGTLWSAPATVSITVTSINDGPIVANQNITTMEDTSVSFAPLASDVEGALTFTILTAPTNGIATVNAGNLVYTPSANYNGSDSFEYQAHDSNGGNSSARVFVTVQPVNDAPVATNQSVIVDEDGFLHIYLGLTDPESNAITRIIVTPPVHGYLTFTTFSVVYWPTSNFSGNDSFTFRGNDGFTDGNIGTVSITIRPVNDFPTALPQTVLAMEDQPIQITLTSQDVEGGPIAYQINGWPTNGGTLSGIDVYGRLPGTNATLTYTPAANFSGTDAFWFRAIDDFIHSAGAWVTVVVQPVNDGPVANNQSRTTAEDTALSVALTGSDIDGDALMFAIVNNPTNGTLSGSAPNFVYTPNTHFNGSDSFTFRASDGATSSAPATVSITVTPQNDPPVANAQNVTLNEDSSRNIVLTGTDPDGDALSFAIISGPAHGTVAGTPPNVVYTPAANYNGTDSFTFRASDSTTNSATVSVSIIVTAVNDTPVANNGSRTLAEDTSAALTLTASDVDGDALTFSIVTAPLHGTLSGTGANVTYTPTTNYNGTDSFSFTGNDGTVESAPATVAITITPVNDRPVPANTTVTLAEDTSTTVTLSGSDVEGSSLSFTLWSLPQNGTITGTAPNLTYTPYGNFKGSNSLQFIVSDGTLLATGIVTIIVTPVNDAPVASDRAFTLNEDWVLYAGATATDIDGDPLTYRVVTPPLGTLNFGTNGGFTYRGPTNYNGIDSFTVVANDGITDGNVATFTITLTPQNDMPYVTNQTLTTLEDTALAIIPLAGDVDGDALTLTVFTSPHHGSVSWNGTQFIYTPATNYHGSDSFEYQAHDPSGGVNTARITIEVVPVNDAPIAQSRAISTPEDTAVAATLIGTEVDGDVLIYRIITAPTNGVLSGSGSARVYTPNPNVSGTDSFTYTVNDGTFDANIATITLTITAVNDWPVANSQSVSLNEDGSLPITLTGSDVEGSPLTFQIAGNPTHGWLTGTAPNVTYNAYPNYNGPDSFSFFASDGNMPSFGATVSISVTPMPDAPIANSQLLNISEDSSVAITLTAVDYDGDPLTYSIVSGPVHGTLTGTPPNLTYTPPANLYGTDSFTFVASDGTLSSSVKTVNINIAGINDAPVANAQSVTVTYNTAKTVILTGSDVEGSGLTYSVVTGPTNGTLTGTAPNLTYTPAVGSAGADFFTFRANDGSSNSAPATVSITTLNPTGIPTAPSGLSITVPTATGTLILNWNCSATNEDGFKIERSLNSGSGWSEIATTGINIHTFTNTGLTSGTRYYYRVRSYNRLGNSAYSNTKDARPR